MLSQNMLCSLIQCKENWAGRDLGLPARFVFIKCLQLPLVTVEKFKSNLQGVTRDMLHLHVDSLQPQHSQIKIKPPMVCGKTFQKEKSAGNGLP